MRDFVLLFATIAAISVSSLGQDPVDSARASIRKVIEDQQTAWNQQNLEAFMAGYWNSPELTFFSGAHESKSWQAALDRYKKNYQGTGHEMGKLEFTNLRIEVIAPGLTQRHRDGILRAVDACLLKNTLNKPPEIEVHVVSSSAVAEPELVGV